MGVVGIVLLSVLGGLFLALVVAGLAVAIWSALKVKQASEELAATVKKSSSDTVEILAQHRVQMNNINEAAKSSFTSIRNDMKGQSEALLREIRIAQEAHTKAVDAAVAAINANELLSASKGAALACRRMEQLYSAFQDLLFRGEQPTMGAEGGKPWSAEKAAEMAPEGASIYDTSEVGQLDEQAQDEENQGAFMR
jgi:hypothetical protein